MINNNSTILGKLTSSVGDVYDGQDGWSYSHHASITCFKDRFWAMWSCGLLNEDDYGQRVVIAESADGLNWENVRPLVTPELLGDKAYIVTAAGFYCHGDTLNVYYGYYKYRRDPQIPEFKTTCNVDTHVLTGLGVISTTDGVHWTEPKALNVPIVPNHPPQRTTSGRLIICGNMMFPYTDDENGLENYSLTGIYGDAFGELSVFDDEFGHKHVSRYYGREKSSESICEGSFYETSDGVLHMMLRAGSGVLWSSESRDNGVNWSVPQPTQYTDCGSKFHFGRLSDGRYYGVSNPVPGSQRIPLSICISEDGENFDKQYIIRDEPYESKTGGMYKGGGVYGYPHTMIHDGYMYVIYSKRKERIEVTRFSIDQLK